jgi:hypothetical protein
MTKKEVLRVVHTHQTHVNNLNISGFRGPSVRRIHKPAEAAAPLQPSAAVKDRTPPVVDIYLCWGEYEPGLSLKPRPVLTQR